MTFCEFATSFFFPAVFLMLFSFHIPAEPCHLFLSLSPGVLLGFFSLSSFFLQWCCLGVAGIGAWVISTGLVQSGWVARAAVDKSTRFLMITLLGLEEDCFSFHTVSVNVCLLDDNCTLAIRAL